MENNAPARIFYDIILFYRARPGSHVISQFEQRFVLEKMAVKPEESVAAFEGTKTPGRFAINSS